MSKYVMVEFVDGFKDGETMVFPYPAYPPAVTFPLPSKQAEVGFGLIPGHQLVNTVTYRVRDNGHDHDFVTVHDAIYPLEQHADIVRAVYCNDNLRPLIFDQAET